MATREDLLYCCKCHHVKVMEKTAEAEEVSVERDRIPVLSAVSTFWHVRGALL